LPILWEMTRIAPGLVVVLSTLLVATTGVTAAPAAKCKDKHACEAKKPAKKPAKPAKKPGKPAAGTGWHNGVYDGGPGDPIIAPLR
jgi:hypothetical protein